METPVTLTLTQIDTFYDPAISVNHCDTLPLDGRVGDTDKVCPTYFSRRRHYRVRRRESPGTFDFSVLDNGVRSDEYWRIVDCADDLSWGGERREGWVL